MITAASVIVMPQTPPDRRYVDLNQISLGDYRYGPFPPVVRAKIEEIQETFAEVCPDSVEAWEDGFRRDLHPLNEIQLWLMMGQTFRHFAATWHLSAKQKQETLGVLLAGCGERPDDVVNSIGRWPGISLSKKQVKQILNHFNSLRASERERSPGRFDFLPAVS